MKPVAPSAADLGYVDGAWWPRTRDLTAELPALFAALADDLGTIERLTYNLDEWPRAARRLQVGDSSVRLGGFRYQGADTIDVTGARRGRITLLVVPPDTPAADAEKITEAAADVLNVDRVGTLLARVAGRNGMPRPLPARA
ncbi:MAG TPA: DUF5994 family protein [Actinophytocola sp.]|jgi:hypothetical protein|uniref:DUF5994 family protein n=1 Tax=Actinophytocola sp. TaxID=1872138 RepID=UPI002F946CF9